MTSNSVFKHSFPIVSVMCCEHLWAASHVQGDEGPAGESQGFDGLVRQGHAVRHVQLLQARHLSAELLPSGEREDGRRGGEGRGGANDNQV